MKLSLEDILDRAIHPMAWQQWIPEEVLLKAPFDTKVMFSNYNGLWIITDTDHKIIWSSEEIEIEEVTISHEVKAQSLLNLMAMLGNNPEHFLEENPEDIA